MAENLIQYTAGTELVSLLKQHGLPKDTLNLICRKVVEIVEEARKTGRSTAQPVHLNGSAQQQAATSAAVALKDFQSADAVLHGVPFVIPRGKFDVGFFHDSMQLSNKQTSALVPYNSIQHVLVIDAIPKLPNTTNVILVMKSGHAVKQAKHSHSIIGIQTKDHPELDLPAPPACQHLGDRLTGAAAVVLSLLLASYIEDIQEDTFLTADAAVFSSSAGDLMISANSGANPGWLVPLSAGLCYVGKPGCFMSNSSISKVLFHRAGGGSSTFDITVKCTAAAKPFELGQIDAAELNKLQVYLMSQRIKIGTEEDDDDDDDVRNAVDAANSGGGRKADAAVYDAEGAECADDDDDEDDGDFDPDASDDDDEDDGRSVDCRASKRQRTSAGPAHQDNSEQVLDDDSTDNESDPVSDEESSDVSLLDEGAISEDDE